MQTVRPDNLLEVDNLIDSFLKKHEQGIATLHRIYFHNSDQLSIRALVAELMDELRTGCVTFLNKDSSMEELDAYLFYIVNDFAKKKAASHAKRKTEYLCPGCLVSGKENLIFIINKFFRCEDCEAELRSATDPKRVAFYRTFYKHNKNGYRCSDCERFIPHPIDDSPVVSCPYFDCVFVGAWSSLRRMHHPNSQSNVEMLTLDADQGGQCWKNVIPDYAMDPQNQLLEQEQLDNNVKLLKEVIDSQSTSIHYSSSEFTVKHKCLVYEAFKKLLKKYPEGMVEYLLYGSRSGGFQHKAFQEYINLLEASIPFSFNKGKKPYKVESLLDPNLNLFDGISVFEGMVSDKLEIKNGTKEFYVGGRKAAYTQPYFMGKILSITEKTSKAPLTDHIEEYSFIKIKMRDIDPGTEVIVTHLRVPPHYQMGGMVHVNRIRKKIVDRAHLLKKGYNE
jgi:hypothetical protein